MPTIGCAIVSRNDNHGGNLGAKAAYCLNSALETYDEVVYVDWNSRDGKTLVDEYIYDLFNYGKLKIVIVTPEQHNRYANGNKISPFNHVTGRNVGLRRLNTDYLVSTNIDEIQPARKYFDKYLNDETVLTAVARHGLQRGLDDLMPLGSWRDIVSVRDKLTTMSFPQAWPIKMNKDDVWSLVAFCGDLQLAHRNLWHSIRGFAEFQKGDNYMDSLLQRKAIEAGYKVQVSYDIPIYHIDHDRSNAYGEYSLENKSSCLTKEFVIPPNDENWGLWDYDLKEYVI
jgi:hypothetical protein